MARGRKKSSDETIRTSADGNTTKATFLEHYDAIVEKLRLKKEADSALGNAYKAAERDGIDKKELKRALADGNLTLDELAVRDRKYALYRAWLDKPVGTQAEMPLAGAPVANGAADDPEEAEAVHNHQNNEAYEWGVAAGKAGAAIASNRYAPGTEEAQSWSIGWSAGQKLAVESLGGATRTASA